MPAKKKTTKKKRASTKKVAKKTTKKKVAKKATKKSVKKTVKKEATPDFDDIPLPGPAVKKSGYTVTKEVAITSALLNIVFAGAGTLLIKEFASATLQIILYLIAAAILLAVKDYTTGWVIAIIATVWALFDSFNAYKQAKK